MKERDVARERERERERERRGRLGGRDTEGNREG